MDLPIAWKSLRPSQAFSVSLSQQGCWFLPLPSHPQGPSSTSSCTYGSNARCPSRGRLHCTGASGPTAIIRCWVTQLPFPSLALREPLVVGVLGAPVANCLGVFQADQPHGQDSAGVASGRPFCCLLLNAPVLRVGGSALGLWLCFAPQMGENARFKSGHARVKTRVFKRERVKKCRRLPYALVDSVSVRLKNARVEKMPLDIRTQWNAGTACVSGMRAKALACWGLRLGPSKFRAEFCPRTFSPPMLQFLFIFCFVASLVCCFLCTCIHARCCSCNMACAPLR